MAEIAVALAMLAGAGGGLYWYVESQKGESPAPPKKDAAAQQPPSKKMDVTVASGGSAMPTGTGATSIGAAPVVQTSIASTIVPLSDPITPPAAAQAQVQASGAPAPSNPCVTSDWSAWSACDPSQGLQQQTRTVTSGDCTGVDMVQTQPCPVDAQAGPWGQWGPCDPLTGYQTRTRSVVSESLNGGAPASALNLTDTQQCAVDCQVGDWGAPQGVCQGGQQTQTRTVTTAALNGGAACPSLSQTIGCQDPQPVVQNQRLTWGDNSGRYLGCYGGTCSTNSWVKSQAMGGVAGAKNGQTWTYNPNNTITSNGQCLDVKNSGKSNGTQIDVYKCNNTGAQQFTWDWAGDHYRLKNPMSGRCLDVPNGGSTQDGIGLQIWDCGTAAGQKWAPV